MTTEIIASTMSNTSESFSIIRIHHPKNARNVNRNCHNKSFHKKVRGCRPLTCPPHYTSAFHKPPPTPLLKTIATILYMYATSIRVTTHTTNCFTSSTNCTTTIENLRLIPGKVPLVQAIPPPPPPPNVSNRQRRTCIVVYLENYHPFNQFHHRHLQ